MPISKFCVAMLCLLTNIAVAANFKKIAKDDWIKLSSKNFEIITDLDETKGRLYIQDLENFRAFTIGVMGVKTLEGLKPLKMLAVSKKRNLNALHLPAGLGGVFGYGTNGYASVTDAVAYKGKLDVSDNARHIMLHEYVHHMMRFTQSSVNYPYWVDEGYADYLATFSFDGKNISLGNADSIKFRTADMFNRNGSLIFESEKLFKTQKSGVKLNTPLISKLYSQSFFAIHYFNSSQSHKEILNKYLRLVNAGYSVDDAFQRAFNKSFADLDVEIKEYLKTSLRSRIFSPKSVGFEFPKIDVAVSTLTPANFYAELTDIVPYFSYFSDEDKADVFNNAISLNQDKKDLAVLPMFYGLTPYSLQAFQQLESGSPANTRLLSMKGDLLSEKSNLLRMAGKQNWMPLMKEARTYYRLAIKADGNFSRPYFGLGRVYDYMPANELLNEAVVANDIASMYVRDAVYFSKIVDALIKLERPLASLPSLRNVIAFSTGDEKTRYGLLLDNIEMYAQTSSGYSTKDGNVLIYADETRYKGTIKNDKPEGFGKLMRSNGSYYEGEFHSGLMDGKGKLVSVFGVTYQGDFKQGIMQGKGEILYVQPYRLKTYNGDVHYGFANGTGILVDENGTYTGNFWYSLPHGQGSFVAKESKTLINGNWVYGGYQWSPEDNEFFVGGINVNGKKEGQGVCVSMSNGEPIIYCKYNNGVRGK